MAKRRKMSNLLALSLLSLLAQRPMYPYEMAQTLRARGKDKNFKINWARSTPWSRTWRSTGSSVSLAPSEMGADPAHHVPDH